MDDLAQAVWNAYTRGEPIAVLPTLRDPGFDLNAAYAIEAAFRHRRLQNGHQPAGRKVGYANKAMWRALKLDTLVWASMYDDTVYMGESELAFPACISPKLEPEIVFKLSKSLPPGDLDGPAILGALEWMALGFEIIDCPYPDWQFKPADFVAAWGLHRALIVGEPWHIEPSPVPGLFDHLATFKLTLLKDGKQIDEGSGKNSLRNPALCLAELAKAVLQRTGSPLEPGELISTGTLTAAQPIAPGEAWVAEAEGLPVAPLVYRNLVGGSQRFGAAPDRL